MQLAFTNYNIVRLLGQGGMANVYLATNTEQDLVAIKVLNTDLFHNSNLNKRFINEAKKMLQLKHPNIVKFIELVEDSDKIAIVMEYVDGLTLREILNKRKLTEEEIKNYLSQIVSALSYFHDKGFIHRDIKPSNFIVDQDNKILLSDFGISKDTSGTIEDYTQTATTASLGTPIYMSPEQVRSVKEVTNQSDIYSLGVLLWEMVEGQKPYDALTNSAFDIQLKIVQEQLPLTNTLWDGLIQKATEKNEINRIHNLEDFLNPSKFTTTIDEKTIFVGSPTHDPHKKQTFKQQKSTEPLPNKGRKSLLFWTSSILILIGFISILIYLSSSNSSKKENSAKTPIIAQEPEENSTTDVDIIPIYDVNTLPAVKDSAYLYHSKEGRTFYRVQNSILFWTFEDNRSWKAKKELNLYKEPYSEEIIDKLKVGNNILGLDVEYHYYKNSTALVSKLHKSSFNECPDGTVNVGDTILLLNAEGECYWNVINKGKFTGVHFSDEGKKLTQSVFDGCNMIEGRRLTIDEEYIVWVKVQAPSRQIGWLKFSNKKGDNFFDKVEVEDEGVSNLTYEKSYNNYGNSTTLKNDLIKSSYYSDTELLSVENTQSYTVVKFKDKFRSAGYWVAIKPDSYIFDRQNNIKLFLKDAYNITISPQETKASYSGETIYWECYFPRVRYNCTSIDFIEPNSDWQFFNVSISKNSSLTDSYVNSKISSASAQAKLKMYQTELNKKSVVFQNSSSINQISICTIFYDGASWVTEGWYNVGSGKSVTLNIPSKSGSTFYYHASGGGYTWSSGSGSKKHCVDVKNAFTYYDNQNHPCTDTRPFIEKSITGKVTTINLGN